jgi:imidazolonepropionase-like amidohydrolase
MRLILTNGNVVTGDGRTIIENSSVVIEDEYIVETRKIRYIPFDTADKIVDAKGGYILPGIINHHTHGASFGPFMPHAQKRLSKERVISNLNGHLMEGTTTLLNCDGLTTMAEVEATKKHHPINLKTSTAHTPKNIETAEMADGTGLSTVHRQTTAEYMIELGVPALGEIGLGRVLAGHGTDQYALPKAIKEKTGKNITQDEARALREAVLGKLSSQVSTSPDETCKALEQIGLKGSLSNVDVRKLVDDVVLKAINVAHQAMMEAGEFAKKLHVPVVMHNAPASKETILEVAKEIGPMLIASHCNEPSFEEQEALVVARQLKKYGAWLDAVSVLQEHLTISEMSLSFFEEGLVDLISTDFRGGYHDSILLFIEKALKKGVVELPQAIAMATSNVARAIPRLAPRRGLIAPGMVADVAIVDADHVSKVDTVVINGRVIVEEGKLSSRSTF